MVLLISAAIANVSAKSSFTFHYGSTYIMRAQEASAVYVPFTFHYGSTYILHRCIQRVHQCYLHSTMVLLI